MFNLFSGGGLADLLKNFMPLAIARLQNKLEEEEKNYQGTLLFNLTNEMHEGVPVTFVTTYGYKKGAPTETVSKVSLKEVIANQDYIQTGLAEINNTLSSFGLSDLLKSYTDMLTPETISEYVQKITDHLQALGDKDNGKVSLNLQVVKGVAYVQTLLFYVGNLTPITKGTSKAEAFICNLLDSVQQPTAA